MNQIIQALKPDPSFEPNHRESSEFYDDVVYVNGNNRVIVCKDSIQWIVQHRSGAAGNPHKAVWRAKHYVTTRETVIRLWCDRTAFVPSEILALPDTLAQRTNNHHYWDFE